MALTFEWDETKSRTNISKHGIAFEEAKTVFNDPLAITIDDPVHADYERRYLEIGLSSKGRLIVVWYTERDESIRNIGCRLATRPERKSYEEREGSSERY